MNQPNHGKFSELGVLSKVFVVLITFVVFMLLGVLIGGMFWVLVALFRSFA